MENLRERCLDHLAAAIFGNFSCSEIQGFTNGHFMCVLSGIPNRLRLEIKYCPCGKNSIPSGRGMSAEGVPKKSGDVTMLPAA